MGRAKRLGSLHPAINHTKIRRRHPTRQTPQRSPIEAADGLMGHRFGPVIEEGAECMVDWQQKEREFFNSLSFLTQLYQFAPVDKEDYPYPQNVVKALEHTTNAVKGAHPDMQLCILQQEGKPLALCTYECFSIDHDLYYIPVAAFGRLLKSRKFQKETNLLCSILSYVHNILEIPFFTEPQSFILDNYQRMKDLEISDDEADSKGFVGEIDQALEQGRTIHTIIHSRSHLRAFKIRVGRYQPFDDRSKKLHDLAQRALSLFQEHPHASIFSFMRPGIVYPLSDEYENLPIQPDEYLSFVSDVDGEVADALFEYVNMDLQERTGTEEPLSYQLFDSPQTEVTVDLSFPRRAIDLLGNLATFLIHDVWTI